MYGNEIGRSDEEVTIAVETILLTKHIVMIPNIKLPATCLGLKHRQSGYLNNVGDACSGLRCAGIGFEFVRLETAILETATQLAGRRGIITSTCLHPCLRRKQTSTTCVWCGVCRRTDKANKTNKRTHQAIETYCFSGVLWQSRRKCYYRGW